MGVSSSAGDVLKQAQPPQFINNQSILPGAAQIEPRYPPTTRAQLVSCSYNTGHISMTLITWVVDIFKIEVDCLLDPLLL